MPVDPAEVDMTPIPDSSAPIPEKPEVPGPLPTSQEPPAPEIPGEGDKTDKRLSDTQRALHDATQTLAQAKTNLEQYGWSLDETGNVVAVPGDTIIPAEPGVPTPTEPVQDWKEQLTQAYLEDPVDTFMQMAQAAKQQAIQEMRQFVAQSAQAPLMLSAAKQAMLESADTPQKRDILTRAMPHFDKFAAKVQPEMLGNTDTVNMLMRMAIGEVIMTGGASTPSKPSTQVPPKMETDGVANDSPGEARWTNQEERYAANRMGITDAAEWRKMKDMKMELV